MRVVPSAFEATELLVKGISDEDMRPFFNAPLYTRVDDAPRKIEDSDKVDLETYGETYFNAYYGKNLTNLKRAMRLIEWPARRNLYNVLQTKYYNLAL